MFCYTIVNREGFDRALTTKWIPRQGARRKISQTGIGLGMRARCHGSGILNMKDVYIGAKNQTKCRIIWIYGLSTGLVMEGLDLRRLAGACESPGAMVSQPPF